MGYGDIVHHAASVCAALSVVSMSEAVTAPSVSASISAATVRPGSWTPLTSRHVDVTDMPSFSPSHSRVRSLLFSHGFSSMVEDISTQWKFHQGEISAIDTGMAIGPAETRRMSKSIAKKSNLNRTFIREWRKSKKITLERLAARIPMAVSSLSRVERGDQPYSQPMLEAIAEALGCAPADLLTRDPSQEPPERRLLDLYARLEEDERAQVRGYIEALASRKAA